MVLQLLINENLPLTSCGFLERYTAADPTRPWEMVYESHSRVHDGLLAMRI